LDSVRPFPRIQPFQMTPPFVASATSTARTTQTLDTGPSSSERLLARTTTAHRPQTRAHKHRTHHNKQQLLRFVCRRHASNNLDLCASPPRVNNRAAIIIAPLGRIGLGAGHHSTTPTSAAVRWPLPQPMFIALSESAIFPTTATVPQRPAPSLGLGPGRQCRCPSGSRGPNTDTTGSGCRRHDNGALFQWHARDYSSHV
jgi:hypothetical protein